MKLLLFSTLLTACDVFRLLGSSYKQADLMVGASYFEIYSGKVRMVWHQDISVPRHSGPTVWWPTVLDISASVPTCPWVQTVLCSKCLGTGISQLLNLVSVIAWWGWCIALTPPSLLASHHLSLHRPFSPDLKLISFTNPFPHSLSGSFRTDFTDLDERDSASDQQSEGCGFEAY